MIIRFSRAAGKPELLAALTKVPADDYAISFSNLLHRDNGTLYGNTVKPRA